MDAFVNQKNHTRYQKVEIMTQLLDLPQIHLQGSFEDMGTQYGKLCGDRIKQFVDMRVAAAKNYFKDWGKGSVEELFKMGEACWQFSEGFDPNAFLENVGIAKATGISPALLYTMTNMTDIRDAVVLAGKGPTPPADAEGCTSALIPNAASADGQGWYGQTWDLNPGDVQYVIAVHRKPKDGLATWSVTCTGSLTLMGINEMGVCVGTTNLKTWGSGVGVGYLSVLHKAVSEPTLALASKVFETAQVAGAHSYWAGDAQGGIEWERSGQYGFLRQTDHQAFGRSNHCLFDQHVDIQGDDPTKSSVTRLQKINTLLNAQKQDLNSLKQIFADRSEGKFSINRYAEDLEGTSTNAVFIAKPGQKVAYACRGPADRGEWVTLQF
jgi:isopenicillin-N N-acyltransferase-like protein